MFITFGKARAVIFPAAEHNIVLAGTKFYCSVTKARGRERLKSRYTWRRTCNARLLVVSPHVCFLAKSVQNDLNRLRSLRDHLPRFI